MGAGQPEPRRLKSSLVAHNAALAACVPTSEQLLCLGVLDLGSRQGRIPTEQREQAKASR